MIICCFYQILSKQFTINYLTNFGSILEAVLFLKITLAPHPLASSDVGHFDEVNNIIDGITLVFIIARARCRKLGSIEIGSYYRITSHRSC